MWGATNDNCCGLGYLCVRVCGVRRGDAGAGVLLRLLVRAALLPGTGGHGGHVQLLRGHSQKQARLSLPIFLF